MKGIDLTGKRFGRLLCRSEVPRQVHRPYDRYWVCDCDCGGERVVFHGNLTAGRIQSCGCYRREFVSNSKRSHGHRKQGPGGEPSRTYVSWLGMKARCTNPRLPAWPNYGGRGITFCKQWQRFEVFLADMGERPEGDYTLDRIDNDAGYSPSNCRWATRIEQGNNRQFNHEIEHLGRTLTATEWSRAMGMPPKTVQQRAERGWPAEVAIGIPIMSSYDLTGLSFYHWLVLSEAPRRPRYQRYWRCRCVCGSEREVNQHSLLHGRSRSCGSQRCKFLSR